ncbi:class I SAM-dependent methyltransferase [Actinopolymorpha alba]|uniref:class I SAM-dependent methyltransferase n=1 Tax=Actinopolymorpha alba TaxID=533267 RepID=UPI000369D468|nr:class I SAM-dependent methyltransferase [Actinopolymorpha alba]
MTEDWSAYLADFHTRRAGQVEQVLRRCTAAGLTPYAWVLRPVAGRGRWVLDVACGSGPVAAELAAEQAGGEIESHPLVIGIDRSEPELMVARRRHGVHVLCADASALPFADESFDAVVCSMSLMVVQPLDRALAECRRVLRPGGMLAATVASPLPLRPGDARILGPLTARLRTPPRFPGGRVAGLEETLTRAGLVVMEDARERFGFWVRNAADAELLLSALYLPDVPDERRQAAADWLAERASAKPGGVEVAIPIRRVLAIRP